MPTRRPTDPRRSRRRRLALRGLVVAVAIGAGGRLAEAGPIADWWASKFAPAPDTARPQDDTSTDGRLMSRWLTKDKTPFSSNAMGSNSVFLGEKGWEKTKTAPNPEAEAQIAAARKLFDAGKFAEAETLLKPLAKKEVKKGTAWGEKAQWLLAESQFRQKKYTSAEPSYELLFKTFPGTEYVDKLVAREYAIAQAWLSDEDPKAKKIDWKARFDGRRPFIDTSGYAIKALEHVQHHDPQGPLADDAALRTADHYHTVGDYETAAVFYDQLLAEHNKSPYRERAQLSSIDAKMKGYIGPEYDASGLEAARETVKRTMAEFPERQAGAEQLYHTLDLIEDQAAEKEYTTGLYYIRARAPAGAEYQFGLVQAKWPRSKWAALSKKEMAKVAKVPRKEIVPSRMMTLPGSTDPGIGGQGTQGGLNSLMGGAGGGGAGGAGGALGGLGGMGGGGMGGNPY